MHRIYHNQRTIDRAWHLGNIPLPASWLQVPKVPNSRDDDQVRSTESLIGPYDHASQCVSYITHGRFNSGELKTNTLRKDGKSRFQFSLLGTNFWNRLSLIQQPAVLHWLPSNRWDGWIEVHAFLPSILWFANWKIPSRSIFSRTSTNWLEATQSIKCWACPKKSR